MSIFDEIKKDLDLYKVDRQIVLDAEKRMKVKFPKDLFDFYINHGCGFVKNDRMAFNRLMDPGSCADIRLREYPYTYDPDLEAYEEYERDGILFFEINEGTYTSIGFEDGKIYYADRVIADSLMEFLKKIRNPAYF